nr:hypothetical protein [Streptomyces sp. IBTA2]
MPADSPVLRQEIFGPGRPDRPPSTAEDEAVRIANDTRTGSAAPSTPATSSACAGRQRIHTGMIHIKRRHRPRRADRPLRRRRRARGSAAERRVDGGGLHPPRSGSPCSTAARSSPSDPRATRRTHGPSPAPSTPPAAAHGLLREAAHPPPPGAGPIAEK